MNDDATRVANKCTQTRQTTKPRIVTSATKKNKTTKDRINYRQSLLVSMGNAISTALILNGILDCGFLVPAIRRLVTGPCTSILFSS